MTSAARTALWRARRHAGREVVPVEIDEPFVDALIGGEFLLASDADDKRKLAEAIRRLHRAYTRQLAVTRHIVG